MSRNLKRNTHFKTALHTVYYEQKQLNFIFYFIKTELMKGNLYSQSQTITFCDI